MKLNLRQQITQFAHVLQSNLFPKFGILALTVDQILRLVVRRV